MPPALGARGRLVALLLLPLLAAWPGAAAAVAAGPSPSALCRAAIAQAEREAGLPARLLAAIGRVESGRPDPANGGRHGPWPWTINAEGRGSFFPDRAAAIAAVRALQAQGVRSIDIGCMQVNLRHHPQAFASLEEAFDPLANARYAARFLRELEAGRGDWMQAAAHYHSQTPDLAAAYRARVATAWEAERSEPGAPASAVARAPGAASPLPTVSWGRAGGGTTLAGSAGRGLDAYRAHPIPAIGRVAVLQRPVAPVVPPAAGGPGAAPGVPIAAPGLPGLSPPTLGLPAPGPGRGSVAGTVAPSPRTAQGAGPVGQPAASLPGPGPGRLLPQALPGGLAAGPGPGASPSRRPVAATIPPPGPGAIVGLAVRPGAIGGFPPGSLGGSPGLHAPRPPPAALPRAAAAAPASFPLAGRAQGNGS